MNTAFRRGFKKQCDEIVAEVRAELDLARHAPFDPFAYAKVLRIPCIPVSDLARYGCSPEALFHVADAGRDDFSAVTIYKGARRMIIYNDANTLARQKSDLAHELAHLLLEHEPGPLFGEGGCRSWNGDHEKEAAWLSGALLVPKHIALTLARQQIGEKEAADRYEVSLQLMRWRLNGSGTVKQAARERNAKSERR